MNRIFILLLFVTALATSEAAETTKKIDNIENNTATDITITPNGGQVVVPYLSTNDLLYYDASGLQGLTIGANDTCLAVSGGVYVWQSCAGSTTLQDAYDNASATNGQIKINETDGGFHIRDTTADPVTTDFFFSITDENDITRYFDVDDEEINTPLNILMQGTDHLQLPRGTTAQRGVGALNGSVRFNTTNTAFEGYDGTSWEEFQLGAVTPSFTTVTKTTAAFLATTGEDNVLADATTADFILNLPAASGNSGLTYKITKITEANTVTVDPNGTETIGGELTAVMESKDDSIIITTDGSNWYYLSDDVKYAARYRTDAAQSIANDTVTTVVYEDLVKDTHDAMNTGTGVYTVPIDGWYDISCSHTYSALNVASGTQQISHIEVNAAIVNMNIIEYTATDAVASTGTVTSQMFLNESDTVECSVKQNSGGSESLVNVPSRNVFSISRL